MQDQHMANLSLKYLGLAVRERRRKAGLTQMQLAEAAGIDQGGLSRIELGKLDAQVETLEKIAGAMGIRLSRLWADAESIANTDTGESTAYQLTATTGRRHVPLISWVEAGQWNVAVDSYPRGSGEEVIATDIPVGRLAYALRVSGDSMTNPRGEEPTFPTGQVVIVDPHRELINGALVICRLIDTEEATFKRYVVDGGRKMLVPLNPHYPVMPVDDDMVYCGTVVAKAERKV